ncbi:MAG: protein kinase domain-containing protein [Actinomycetota bacterium]
MQAFDSGGRRLDLLETPAGGGEGRIFRVAGDSLVVAKIFHQRRASPELEKKLLAMVARPPEDPTWKIRRHRSIAWPLEVLYSDQGKTALAGYTMPAIDTALFREAHCYYDTSDRVRRFGGAYTWRHLLIAARNLASAVAAIHDKGYRIGDLTDTNVLMAPNSLVALIDCDSFQVVDEHGRAYPTRVGTGEYLPPELQAVDFRTQTPDRYLSDLFALAVLVFKLLMIGSHPFQAKGEAVADLPSTEAKIAAGTFPYRARNGLHPPEFAPDFKTLPSTIRRLAFRAFVDGHGRPEARPDAHQWLSALDAEGPVLKACRENPHHVFGGHLRSCPWCRLAPRLRMDPFPPKVAGDQAAAPQPGTANPLTARYERLRSFVQVALVDGSLSIEERDYIGRLGAELGLHKAEVSRIVGEQERKLGASRRATKPLPSRKAPQPANTPQAESRKRDLSELRRLLADHGRKSEISPRERLAEASIGLVLVLAALAAPALVASVVVVLLVPALTTAGQVRTMKLARTRTWRILLTGISRLPQNAALSIYYLIPTAMAGAVGGLVVAWSAPKIGVPAEVPLRILTSGVLVFWLWWLLHRAKEGEDFLRLLRGSASAVLSWTIRPLRYRYRHVFLSVPAAALLLRALTGGGAVWWPLG